MRIARIKYISKQHNVNGQIKPCFNIKGCFFFKEFDRTNKTRGQYATNGGEHYISELGYFVDYFNPKLKLIMEWDEESHYAGGKLKKRDIERQIEIQKIYPEFIIKRIRERNNKWLKKELKFQVQKPKEENFNNGLQK